MSGAAESLAVLLIKYRTIAVVGLSIKPDRPSHEVAQYMQRHGYRIIPVNPACAGMPILNEFCYPSLTQASATLAKENVRIEIVNCFRRSELIPPIADEAITIGAKCLWLQLGVADPGAAAKAQAAGLTVVMDHCIKLAHMYEL